MDEIWHRHRVAEHHAIMLIHIRDMGVVLRGMHVDAVESDGLRTM